MAPAPHAADDTIRVLFIEDDPAVAEMYKLKLELDGYLVSIHTSSDDLVETVATIKPELVFLDTQRLDDGGKMTLRTIRALPATAGVPVIILSNQRPNELAEAGFATDVMDYVVYADLSFGSLSRDVQQWSVGQRSGIPA